MTILSWIPFALAVFLVADAVLAVVLGKPYMMWGLGYTPSIYRDFIIRLSDLPQGTLLGIKLVECVAGLVLFWFGMRMR